MDDKMRAALEKAGLNPESWEEANRLGELVRERTGVCCGNLADLKWGFYEELVQRSNQSKEGKES